MARERQMCDMLSPSRTRAAAGGLAVSLLVATTSLAKPVGTAAESPSHPGCDGHSRKQLRVILHVAPEFAGLRLGIRTVVSNAWKGEGLHLVWLSSETELHASEADSVPSIVLSDFPERSRQQALGWIHAPEGVIGRRIAIPVRAIVAWLRSHRPEPTMALRERAIGYIVAHELGHFLLQSKTHAPAGLMRATLTFTAVLDDAVPALDADSRERLRSRAATLSCGPPQD